MDLPLPVLNAYTSHQAATTTAASPLAACPNCGQKTHGALLKALSIPARRDETKLDVSVA